MVGLVSVVNLQRLRYERFHCALGISEPNNWSPFVQNSHVDMKSIYILMYMNIIITYLYTYVYMCDIYCYLLCVGLGNGCQQVS